MDGALATGLPCPRVRIHSGFSIRILHLNRPRRSCDRTSHRDHPLGRNDRRRSRSCLRDDAPFRPSVRPSVHMVRPLGHYMGERSTNNRPPFTREIVLIVHLYTQGGVHPSCAADDGASMDPFAIIVPHTCICFRNRLLPFVKSIIVCK